jgi:uncharacterized protein YukE
MATNTPFEVTEDADPHVKNINEHLRTTDQLMRKMEDETEHMLQQNWHGQQAQAFHQRMQEHLDHMRSIQSQTDHLAQSSMQYIQAHRNLDA